MEYTTRKSDNFSFKNKKKEGERKNIKNKRKEFEMEGKFQLDEEGSIRVDEVGVNTSQQKRRSSYKR